MKPHKQEIWKQIKGFEGHYDVSNFGQVKSLERTKQNGNRVVRVPSRILKQAQTNYPSVSLWIDGKLKVTKVHRLVACAFIDNPENKPEVNHKDANRQNNCVDNLEWVTRKENCHHAKVNNLMPSGNNHKKSKLTEREVENIKNSHWCSQRLVAEAYGVSQSLISMIRNGKVRKEQYHGTKA